MPHIIGGTGDDIAFMEQGAGAAGAHGAKAHHAALQKVSTPKPEILELKETASAPLPGNTEPEPLLTSADLEMPQQVQPVALPPAQPVAPRPVTIQTWTPPETNRWQQPKTILHANRKQVIINR